MAIERGNSIIHYRTCMLLTLFGSLSVLGADGSTASHLRRFTVRDSVEMVHFGTLEDTQPEDLDDDGIASPNGRFFIKVTHRGKLPEGLTVGTIWLFDVASTRKSIRHPQLPSPVPSLPAIAGVRSPVRRRSLPPWHPPGRRRGRPAGRQARRPIRPPARCSMRRRK